MGQVYVSHKYQAHQGELTLYAQYPMGDSGCKSMLWPSLAKRFPPRVIRMEPYMARVVETQAITVKLPLASLQSGRCRNHAFGNATLELSHSSLGAQTLPEAKGMQIYGILNTPFGDEIVFLCCSALRVSMMLPGA